jgi:LacI family transcriptional regulator
VTGVAMSDGRRPTLRDVAARAGVSFKTVSRVVNEEPGVSPAMADRVRQAVEELGFRPNVGARVLRRPDTATPSIGLLLDDVADPFSAAVLRAVHDVALARGALVLSASTDDDPGRERTIAAAFLARGAEGLLLVPTVGGQAHLAAAVRAGTAVVCLGRAPRDLAVDVVTATDAAGAAAAVEHLVAAGHTRIAYLGDRATVGTARERLAGYRRGLSAAGLRVDPALEVADLPAAAAAEPAVAALCGGFGGPTALFTVREAVTVAAVRGLHRLGRQRLVALVGFGDLPTADLLSPGLTVVAHDPAAIGRRAAGLLLARMAGEAGPPAVHSVPTVLIPRGSGELPPPPR